MAAVSAVSNPWCVSCPALLRRLPYLPRRAKGRPVLHARRGQKTSARRWKNRLRGSPPALPNARRRSVPPRLQGGRNPARSQRTTPHQPARNPPPPSRPQSIPPHLPRPWRGTRRLHNPRPAQPCQTPQRQTPQRKAAQERQRASPTPQAQPCPASSPMRQAPPRRHTPPPPALSSRVPPHCQRNPRRNRRSRLPFCPWPWRALGWPCSARQALPRKALPRCKASPPPRNPPAPCRWMRYRSPSPPKQPAARAPSRSGWTLPNLAKCR